MKREDVRRRVDEVRSRSSEHENHLIDEYRAGYIDRREFMRRGTVVGMSLSLTSFLAAACGSGEESGGGSSGSSDTQAGAKVKPGGTIRTGLATPGSAVDPLVANNQGALSTLSLAGEFLVWSNSKLQLEPRLAESWTKNEDGSEWTFKIRQGVKFNDGTPLTTEDVVETFDRLVDPKNGANSLSATSNVLSKGKTTAVDATTVKFELDSANGNFPYIVSSDNYNSIILPKSYEGDWDKTFPGTGPWKLEKYTPDVGVQLVKNPDYWDKTRQVNADRNEVKYYAKEQAATLGLQGDEVDFLVQFSVSGGKPLLSDPNVTVISLKSAAHRQLHMRTDKEPFNDKRVRQALALVINRAAIVDGLFEKRSDLGNDSPFAPVYPSTDKTVPQRKQDLAKAKALLEEAGKSNLDVELRIWDGFEMPDYAQLVQSDAKAVGFNIKLKQTDSASYYGDAVFGNSPWLDSTMGITEYGHRGVPNVYLNAPLRTGGVWNSAHFKNKEYDKLVVDYTKSLDLQSQRAAAKAIQTLLADEVPIVFSYFYNYLGATKKTFGGVQITAMGHADTTGAGLTA